ncbi:hypothetical protein FTO74_00675 [Granulicella sp. WH15]|uniref:hypothetical protein n=1 Tax=Granulicella sp. WH15 TaxID=2602070 RepID=UPI0013671EA7|nr:hypothetical protein [Granulicella sp. WH15]QHN02059.1 hypothetical protein FTO74_00675 [Granulicella sp. WH15]
MISVHKLSLGTFHGAALSAILFGACLFTGCKSKMDKAIEQAKQQAAATGQAQQVISTDDSGTTTTTVVQPPAPGQTTQQVTTTTSSSKSVPASASAPPAPAPGAAPVVSAYNAAPAASPAPPMMSDGSSAPPAPAPAPNSPVVSPVNIHVPAGTSLAIRINQRISVKTSRAGERFTGEVEAPVTVAGSDSIVIPRGTHVDGAIVEAHRRGHFKGRSILELRLISMTLNGQRYALNTHDLTQTKKGKGKRSAAFIGGGTGLGMLIGGVATGGVGLLVGGAVGAGTGTALGGLTGNRDIVIPAESVMNFRLADDLVIQPS